MHLHKWGHWSESYIVEVTYTDGGRVVGKALVRRQQRICDKCSKIKEREVK